MVKRSCSRPKKYGVRNKILSEHTVVFAENGVHTSAQNEKARSSGPLANIAINASVVLVAAGGDYAQSWLSTCESWHIAG